MKILQYYNDVIRQPYVYKRIVTDQQYIIRIDDESYIYLYFVQEDKHFVKFAVVAKKTQTGYHIVNISSYDDKYGTIRDLIDIIPVYILLLHTTYMHIQLMIMMV